MAITIKDSLNQINVAIKQTQTNARLAAYEARKYEKALKVDPTNVELISSKFEAQRRQLAYLNQNLQNYDKLMETTKQKDIEEGKSKEQIALNLSKIDLKLQKVKDSTIALTEATAAESEAAAIAEAKQTKFANNLETVGTATDKVAQKFAILAAAIGVVATKTVSAGAELYNFSNKYGSSVEEIQKNQNLFKQLAQDSSAYEQSLKTLTNVQRALQGGSGNLGAYTAALDKLGISLEAISTSSAAEGYQMIFESLQKITDETERANIAALIFGDTGNDVAAIAGTSSEIIEKLNSDLERYGMLTTEDVLQLKQVSYEFGLAKQSITLGFQKAIITLMPLLMKLASLIQQLGKFMQSGLGKGILYTTLALTGFITAINIFTKLMKTVTVVTKLAATAKKIYTVVTTSATAADVGLNVALIQTVALVSALTLGVGLLIGGISLLIAKEQTATATTYDFTSQMKDAEDQYADLINNTGLEDFNANSSTAISTSNEKTINFNIDLYGHGDTSIGDDNATVVGKVISADMVNKLLGEVI